ncbi:MAG: 16S rRNA (uracil(1498)-N(3))-methyltransferase [Bdellovibrionales bacterium]|nr:16S rRNA (uracil(1498)-N(3))-methyltransferase [Bdellovibrionales bacterium]
MPRFLYLDSMAPGQVVCLSREESHHLFNVLRIREHAPVELVDGKGAIASGTVSKAAKNATEVLLSTVESRPRSSRIRLCFSLAKHQATEFLVRRCTELGVSAFQPLITDFGMPAKAWKRDRWERVVEEVCKQCQEVWFPEVCEPIAFDDWIGAASDRTIVACDENDRGAKPEVEKLGDCDLALGAEGGWSEGERRLLNEKAIGLGLGSNRLRTETASLVALTLLKEKMGELQPVLVSTV